MTGLDAASVWTCADKVIADIAVHTTARVKLQTFISKLLLILVGF
jgi:hypothetical protein